MIDELGIETNKFLGNWNELVAIRTDQELFKQLAPTAVAWKVEDLSDFDRRFASLRDQCDQIHLGFINERWLAVMHLKDAALPGGIQLVKLMQRRPGSTDATGLDHVDFYSPDVNKAKLEAEPDLKWTEEHNGEYCKWLSIWFADTEAKLRTDTTLQVCAEELLEVQTALLA